MLKPFRAGTVFNRLSIPSNKSYKPRYKRVQIAFPARLNAMAIDPSRIAVNQRGVYTAGEVVFSIALYKKVIVALRKDDELRIAVDSPRKALIKHAFLLMKKALKFRHGLDITINSSKQETYHAGLGSSSGLVASIACAINELYGTPIAAKYLLKYLAQNHGEEIKGEEDYLFPVQSLGGSAASGLYLGGLILIAGENNVIATMNIPTAYSAVVGIPKEYIPMDAKKLMALEMKRMDNFVKTGKLFGPIIAYRIVHDMLPAMAEKNIKVIGDVIYDYRFRMGSIKNCAYAYKKLPQLMNKLAFLKTQGIADVLSVSSVGPGVFVITKNQNQCEAAFQRAGLKAFATPINNDKYQVLEAT